MATLAVQLQRASLVRGAPSLLSPPSPDLATPRPRALQPATTSRPSVSSLSSSSSSGVADPVASHPSDRDPCMALRPVASSDAASLIGKAPMHWTDHPDLSPLAHPSRPATPHLSSQDVCGDLPSSASSSTCASSSRWPEASAYPTCRLTVVLTAAKGLAVPAAAAAHAKPYAVLQFDQTESVTRAAGEAEDLLKLAKGKRIVAKWRGFRTIRAARTPTRTREPSPSSGTSTPCALSHHPPSDPVWNHTATFDVIQPRPHVHVSVYDRGVQEGVEGFLGGAVVELEADGRGQIMNDWVALWDKDSAQQVGQVHFRMEIADVTPSLPKDRRVSIQDFHVIKHIGEGSFGQVYRVQKRDTKRFYAMKVLSKKDIVNRHGVQHVLAERQILAKTSSSPFLVGLKFSFQTPDSLHFVIDLKSGGELMSYMQRYGGKFPESWVVFYTAEILSGLEFLHSMNIVYRDLKPENCLLDSLGHVALCDFGLSKLDMDVDGRATTFCGTTEYIAPEVLLEVPYGRSVDFWALGVLIFEMTLGWTPFFNEDRIEKYNLILQSNIAAKIPKRGVSQVTRDIISNLLERSVPQRLGSNGGAMEVSSHPFFCTIQWDALRARRLTPPFKPTVDSDDMCEYMERQTNVYQVGQVPRRSSADDLLHRHHQPNILSDAGFGNTTVLQSRTNSADDRPQEIEVNVPITLNGHVVPSISPVVGVHSHEPFRGFTFSRDTSMEQLVPPPSTAIESDSDDSLNMTSTSHRLSMTTATSPSCNTCSSSSSSFAFKTSSSSCSTNSSPMPWSNQNEEEHSLTCSPPTSFESNSYSNVEQQHDVVDDDIQLNKCYESVERRSSEVGFYAFSNWN